MLQLDGATKKAVGKVTVSTGLAPGTPVTLIANFSRCESPLALVTVLVPQPEVKAMFPVVCVVPVMESEPNNATAPENSVPPENVFPPSSTTLEQETGTTAVPDDPPATFDCEMRAMAPETSMSRAMPVLAPPA